MTATHQPDRQGTVEQSRHWHVRVAVRVPRDDSGGLLGDASRRLGRPTGVESVTVEELRGLDPGLGATVAELAVRVETAVTGGPEDVERLVGAAPGTESVEGVEAIE
jgi:hypothetical protein